MKKIFAVALSTTVLATSVIPSSASAERINYNSIHESELGNTYKYATPVNMFSQITGAIHSNNTDMDYYSLHVTEKTDIAIALSMLEKNRTSALRLELYNDQLELID